MATTFKEAKDKAVFYLDDINYGYFTDAIVSRYVNDAQFEVQKKLIQAGSNYYIKPVYTTLIVGQADYAAPSDMLKVNRLEFVTQQFGTANEITQTIMPITLNQRDVFPFTQGSPAGYYLSKSKFWLVPAPDTAYQLKLWYSYRVAPLTANTQILDVPEEFVELVPILAAIDGFIRDGRDPGPLLEKKAFYERLFEQEAQRRTEDAPRMVVSTTDGGFGVLF